MKIILSLLALILTASIVATEDYQCGNKAGCKARHTEDGELIEEVFRYGDMVSTDAGYTVSTDDGWVKVKTTLSEVEQPIPSTSLIGSSFNVYQVDAIKIGEEYIVIVRPVIVLNSASGLNDTGVLARMFMPTSAYCNIITVQVP